MRGLRRAECGLAAVEEETREADDAAEARPEHECESERPEDQRRDGEIRDVLDRDVDAVLRPHEAGLKAEESHLHENDEDRREEDP